jgi:hypothetical protein
VAQVDLVQLEVNEVDLKYVHSEHKWPLQFQEFTLKQDTTSTHLDINYNYQSLFYHLVFNV